MHNLKSNTKGFFQNISLKCQMETVCLDDKGPHETLKEDSGQAGEAQ